MGAGPGALKVQIFCSLSESYGAPGGMGSERDNGFSLPAGLPGGDACRPISGKLTLSRAVKNYYHISA